MRPPHAKRFLLARPSTKAIVLLVAVAIASALVGVLSNRFDNWAPNVTSEAIFVALAVGVIDRLLKREERDKLRPRLNRIEQIIQVEFARPLEAIAYDYAQAHPIETRPIPLSSLRLIEVWLEGVEGGARSEWGPDERPHVLLKLEEFASRLDQIRIVDRELLTADLVRNG